MTFGDYIEQFKAEGARTGKDLAYATLWQRNTEGENVPVEVQVIWLDSGRHPKTFPRTDVTHETQHWDKSWTIIRCTPQPTAQVISLTPGRFLDAMPDIKLN